MSENTVQNTLSLPDLVANTKIKFAKEKAMLPEVLRKSGIINEMSIAANSGTTRVFDEIENESFAARKGEGQNSKKSKTIQGYKKTGYMYRIGSEKDITWELRNYSKYPEINAKIKNLSTLGGNRLALDLAHRIGFGTQTSYIDQDGVSVDITVGDTKALFATDHSLKGTTTTYRNILSGNAPFSKSSLQSMITMRKVNKMDHYGVPLMSNDDVIFSTDDETTVEAIEELLRSRSSTDNDKNSGVYNRYGGSYKHVVIPYLDCDERGIRDTSKAKYWGVVDTSITELMLGMHMEPHMKIASDTGKSISEDFSTDNITVGVRGSWMIVSPSAKYIALSKGDNT